MAKSYGYILVVDDDETIREFVSLVLEDEGYVVKTARNGAVALTMADQTTPNLILLDMRMPVMNGWQFVEAYRQTAPTKDKQASTDESKAPGTFAANSTRPKLAPIIVMTAATDASAFAKDIKAEAYLAKPFDIDDLLKLVAQLASSA